MFHGMTATNELLFDAEVWTADDLRTCHTEESAVSIHAIVGESYGLMFDAIIVACGGKNMSNIDKEIDHCSIVDGNLKMAKK